MPIPVECEQCSATFQVPEEHAGKRGRCRRCGTIVSIPELFEPEVLEPEIVDADFLPAEIPAPVAPQPAAPAVNPIFDEDEEYALASGLPAAAKPAGRAPAGAPRTHRPPPGGRTQADIKVARPMAVAAAAGLYSLTLFLVIALGAAAGEEAIGFLMLLWIVGFAVVIVVAVLKCQVRYEASISPTGKPILAVEKYFLGWRQSCEILNLNDFSSVRRVDFEPQQNEMDETTGCLVFFFFGLPGLLIYALANNAGNQRARYEVVFSSRRGPSGTFTATFGKPRQAAELTKIVGEVAGLPLERMSDFPGMW